MFLVVFTSIFVSCISARIPLFLLIISTFKIKKLLIAKKETHSSHISDQVLKLF